MKVKKYIGGNPKLKVTEWLPYLSLCEEESAVKVLELDYIWEITKWENCMFLEIREETSKEIMGRCILASIPNNHLEYGLFAIYVTPIFRKQGVATKLLDYCIKTVRKEKGFIKLGTRVDNTIMNNLLQKKGFKIMEVCASDISGKEENKYTLSFLEKG